MGTELKEIRKASYKNSLIKSIENRIRYLENIKYFEYKNKLQLIIVDLYNKMLKTDKDNILNKQKKSNKLDSLPLMTRIDDDLANKLVCEFFSSIDIEWGEKVKEIIENKNRDIKIKKTNLEKSEENNNKPFSKLRKLLHADYEENPEARVQPLKLSNKKIIVYLPKRNSLRKVYEAVHELTHVLNLEGDTFKHSTRFYLAEADSLSMENILDEYLLNLSPKEMEVYGFDKETLENDICMRKYGSFLSRMGNLFAYGGNKDLENKNINGLYSYGQLFASQIRLDSVDEKRKKIKELLLYIKNDQIKDAFSYIGINLDYWNDGEKEKAISNVVEEYKTLDAEMKKRGLNLETWVKNVTENTVEENSEIR